MVRPADTGSEIIKKKTAIIINENVNMLKEDEIKENLFKNNAQMRVLWATFLRERFRGHPTKVKKLGVFQTHWSTFGLRIS